MERQLLIAIHPEYACNILNLFKTREARTWIPKNFVGWVNVYITQGKSYLYQTKRQHGKKIVLNDKNGYNRHWLKDFNKEYGINGKVAFRFWFEKYDTYKFEDGDYWNADLEKLCLTYNQVYEYGKGKTLYAWNINKLEIFDKPKELSEFWSEPIDFSIHTRAEALAEGYKPIQRAPQKCAWVYTKE